MLHNLRFFFSSKCRLFHNATFFGSCIIHILNTGCAKILKGNSGAKVLTGQNMTNDLQRTVKHIAKWNKPFMNSSSKRKRLVGEHT